MPFSEDALVNTHNGELVKILGNLMNRLCKMVHKACGGNVPDVTPSSIDKIFDFEAMRTRVDRLYSRTLPDVKGNSGDGAGEEQERNGFDIQESTKAAMNIFREANK